LAGRAIRVVGQGGDVDERIVVDDVFARLQNGAVGEVAVGVLERVGGEVRIEGELLLPDSLVAVVAGSQDE